MTALPKAISANGPATTTHTLATTQTRLIATAPQTTAIDTRAGADPADRRRVAERAEPNWHRQRRGRAKEATEERRADQG